MPSYIIINYSLRTELPLIASPRVGCDYKLGFLETQTQVIYHHHVEYILVGVVFGIMKPAFAMMYKTTVSSLGHSPRSWLN